MLTAARVLWQQVGCVCVPRLAVPRLATSVPMSQHEHAYVCLFIRFTYLANGIALIFLALYILSIFESQNFFGPGY